jgi:hypothetical protein
MQRHQGFNIETAAAFLINRCHQRVVTVAPDRASCKNPTLAAVAGLVNPVEHAEILCAAGPHTDRRKHWVLGERQGGARNQAKAGLLPEQGTYIAAEFARPARRRGLLLPHPWRPDQLRSCVEAIESLWRGNRDSAIAPLFASSSGQPPDCALLGHGRDLLSYAHLNAALQLLM